MARGLATGRWPAAGVGSQAVSRRRARLAAGVRRGSPPSEQAPARADPPRDGSARAGALLTVDFPCGIRRRGGFAAGQVPPGRPCLGCLPAWPAGAEAPPGRVRCPGSPRKSAVGAGPRTGRPTPGWVRSRGRLADGRLPKRDSAPRRVHRRAALAAGKPATGQDSPPASPPPGRSRPAGPAWVAFSGLARRAGGAAGQGSLPGFAAEVRHRRRPPHGPTHTGMGPLARASR